MTSRLPGDLGESESRRIVQERANGRCESCGQAGPLEWSHRKGRGQQGKWHPANGIGACRVCHDYFHAHPEEAYENGWFVSGSVPDADVWKVPIRLRTWLGVGWYRLLPWGGYDVIMLDDVDPYQLLQGPGKGRA